MELTYKQAMQELAFWRTEYRKTHNTLKQVQEVLELNKDGKRADKDLAYATALFTITKSPAYPCQLCGREDCNGNHDANY